MQYYTDLTQWNLVAPVEVVGCMMVSLGARTCRRIRARRAPSLRTFDLKQNRGFNQKVCQSAWLSPEVPIQSRADGKRGKGVG